MITPKPWKDSYLAIDLYQDGRRPETTYFYDRELQSLPIKIKLFDPEKYVLWSTRLEELPPLGSCDLAFPRTLMASPKYLLIYPETGYDVSVQTLV